MTGNSKSASAIFNGNILRKTCAVLRGTASELLTADWSQNAQQNAATTDRTMTMTLRMRDIENMTH
jgi:hypothetical protein